MQSSTNSKYIHPKLFALYLAMGSMVMLFSSLCSALLVKRGDIPNWENVSVPTMFFWSTVLIIISSFSAQWMYKKYIENNSKQFYLFGIFTLIIAILFMAMQWLGYQELMGQMIFLKGNPSGSFLYVISGFHAFHYLFGILFLFGLLTVSRKKTDFFSNNSNLIRLKLIVQYWHFIGLVWVFLYIFFKFVIYNN